MADAPVTRAEGDGPRATSEAIAEIRRRWLEPSFGATRMGYAAVMCDPPISPYDLHKIAKADIETLLAALPAAPGGGTPLTEDERAYMERVAGRLDGMGYFKAVELLRRLLMVESRAAAVPPAAAQPPAEEEKMATDTAIYVTFTEGDKGTAVRATRGYSGPVIAALRWERRLSGAEQIEVAAAIRRVEGQ